jgi:tetratricopeptide (TPR) repeat protein
MLRWVLATGLVLLTTAVLADSKTDCLDSKDHELRIKGCSAILLRNPKDVIAYHNRGEAYALKGDVDRAIADYTKAIELNPNYAPSYNSRGRAYTSKGDYIHAVADVTKAGELTPKLRPWPVVVKAAPAKPKDVAAKAASAVPGNGTTTEKAPVPTKVAVPTKAPVATKAPVPTKAPVAEKPADDSWPLWAQSKLSN